MAYGQNAPSRDPLKQLHNTTKANDLVFWMYVGGNNYLYKRVGLHALAITHFVLYQV